MERIFGNIIETVGNTPLVRINKLNTGKAELLVKLESFNPGGSAKDRVGIAMIDAAEKAGKLKSGGVIIEPTSGNTGVGLALAAAVKGYHLILTMPDTMSVERRRLLKAYGAELILTPGKLGMKGAIDKAESLCKELPGAFIPQQFENPANPDAHRYGTAEEIWRDCNGIIDGFVAGVGTGGTITGTSEALKKYNPALLVTAVEPDTSAVLSGKEAGTHKLQGIGAGFIPSVLNTKIIDRIVPVSAEDAGNAARNAAVQEGMLIGISGGAALAAGLAWARCEEMSGKRIVVLIPDTGERYLSTWLFAGDQQEQ